MESKFDTNICDSNNAFHNTEMYETLVFHNEEIIKKANIVRTTLLVHVDNDNNVYLKNSKVMINSQMPKEIIRRYEKFEKKFDNPLIVGTIRRKSRMHSTSLKSSDINAIKTTISNAKNEHADSFINTSSINLLMDSRQLEFANFLENKKISCAHKKFKTSVTKINNNQRRRCSLDKFNSNISNANLFQKFLSEEELKKLKILDGFEKLNKLAREISSSKLGVRKKNRSMPRKNNNQDDFDKKVKQYEELLEILEFKDIKFKSKFLISEMNINKFNRKEYSNSVTPQQRNAEVHKSDDSAKKKIYDNSSNPKRKIMSIDDIHNEILSSSKNYKESDGNIDIIENKNTKQNKTNSSKKLKIPREKDSDKKSSNKTTKGFSEMSTIIDINNFSNQLSSIDKFVFEKHPNSMNKFTSNNNPPTHKKEEIDYDNYRINLNSSIIQIRDEEDNSNNNSNNISRRNSNNKSDNGLSDNNSITDPIITLKPTDLYSNYKGLFSSLSFIDCNTNEQQQDFNSYADYNYNTKNTNNGGHQKHIPDNYDEYENYILNLKQCPQKSAININADPQIENEYVSNGLNTYSDISSNTKGYSTVSNHSKITYISKSSDEMDD